VVYEAAGNLTETPEWTDSYWCWYGNIIEQAMEKKFVPVIEEEKSFRHFVIKKQPGNIHAA